MTPELEHGNGSLIADEPIVSGDQDLLDRVELAEAIADVVLGVRPGTSLTCAVQGPWGSGKTSVLHLVAACLRESERPPLVVAFNPWLFSGVDDLLRRFFEELTAELRGHDRRKRYKKTRKALEALADGLEPIDWVPVVGPWSTRLGRAARMLLKRRRSDESLAQQRDATAAILKQQNRQIVLLVDDVDRLEPREIRQVFQLVRLIGDLPNMVYVLAFDRVVVEKIIDSGVGVDGHAYLDKIIQVGFDLPNVSPEHLKEMVTKSIDRVAKDLPAGPFDNHIWTDLLIQGILPLVRTPRDAVRLANSLSLTVRHVGEEVSYHEVIALEALRALRPEVFRILRRGYPWLVSVREPMQGQDTERTQVSQMIEKAAGEDRDAVFAILSIHGRPIGV